MLINEALVKYSDFVWLQLRVIIAHILELFFLILKVHEVYLYQQWPLRINVTISLLNLSFLLNLFSWLFRFPIHEFYLGILSHCSINLFLVLVRKLNYPNFRNCFSLFHLVLNLPLVAGIFLSSLNSFWSLKNFLLSNQ